MEGYVTYRAGALALCAASLLAAQPAEVLDPALVNWASPAQYRLSEPAANAKAPERAAVSAPLVFVAITPCRIADTRNTPDGTFAGPILQAGATRTFPIPTSACGIPAGARAYSLNFTVDMTGLPGLAYLTAWPAGEPQPPTSVMNAPNAAVKYLANAAVIPAGQNGAISVFASDTVHLVLDINGYYIESGGSLPAAIAEDSLTQGPAQVAAQNVPLRIAPSVTTLDTDNGVAAPPEWSYVAPRTCVWHVTATVRNLLAFPGFHEIYLMTAPAGGPAQTASHAITHTSQIGVPATVGLSTHLVLPSGSRFWIDYRQSFATVTGVQSRITAHCARPLP